MRKIRVYLYRKLISVQISVLLKRGGSRSEQEELERVVKERDGTTQWLVYARIIGL